MIQGLDMHEVAMVVFLCAAATGENEYLEGGESESCQHGINILCRGV